MKKTYILDTNVLIQAPYAVSCFEDNDVIIPLKVVEELDGLKKADGEKGACARQTVRILEQMRHEGDLLAGVSLKDGGSLRIETNYTHVNYTHVELPKDLLTEKADNRILQVCKGLQEKNKVETLILVTKDIVMRLKAQLLGIKAEDFSTEQISEQDKEYTGRTEAYIPDKYIKDFKKQGISVKKLYWSDEEGNREDVQVFENEFILLKSDVGNRRTLLGKIRNGKAYPLEYKKKKPYDISPRNMGQYFLQEALMAPASEIPLVIVQGMAGTAKTFYSLAVGLEKVYNNPTGEYRRIIVCRPNAQFDDDIGFLPGSEQEKIAPLMRPIIDNLEQILDSDEEKRYEDDSQLSDKIQEIFEREIIQTEALTYIRGRSIAKTYLIIDEAQNMTPNQVKGIITRAGKDTKIILLGLLRKGNENLGMLGYTDHSTAHCCLMAETAGWILEKFHFPEHEIELAKIAGYMHDIGNAINRKNHAEYGALLANDILKQTDLSLEDRIEVVSCIGNHDESTGSPFDAVSAAVILADKTDVRKNRVREKERVSFDIHDRVNYAVTGGKLKIHREKKVISLNLQIDESICTMYDYFEIFLGRMMMCRKAAELLDAKFKLTVNGSKVL